MLPPDINSLSQTVVHISTMSWAIMVCISATILFWTAHRHEKIIKTPWRAFGFGALAASFTLAIIARFIPFAIHVALVLEAIAFAAILYGVYRDLNITHLRENPARRKKFSKNPAMLIIGVSTTVALSVTVYIISSAFILATIPLQIKRFTLELRSPRARLQNLYPLAAYLFLFLRSILLLWFIFNPEATILWYLAMVSTNFAFIFLAVWAWIFIRVRKPIRTPIIVVVIAAITASAFILLGTLLFIVFIRSILG